MSFKTVVNSQPTDSLTQVNTKVIGDSPVSSMGNFMIVTSQALSNAAHNATTGQQQTGITSQAAITQGVSVLYSIDTASEGASTAQVFQ